MTPPPSPDQNLCLTCGLCCNGVIFADVQLQPGDDAFRLKSLGLPLRVKRPRILEEPSIRSKFPQPCAALDGCHCRIYADRPHYCRMFECALLQNVKSAVVSPSEARRLIRSARQRAEKVRRLLCELGETEETLSLSRRFQRLKKRVESTSVDEETADLFGQLSLAVHELNFILSEVFYPGPGD